MKNLAGRISILGFILIVMIVPTFAQDTSSEDIPSCILGSTCETGTFGLSSAVIEQNPVPNVRQIVPDESVLYDRRYRRVDGATHIYDTPGGSVTNTLDTGFNFFTLMNEQNGWAQIAPDQWVKSDNLTNDVALSRFAGVYLPEEPLTYTVAWLLVHLRPSEYPGGEPSNDNPFMYRYTVVNIYDTVMVGNWRWYQIGVDEWVKQTQVAKILPVERFEEIDTERWVSVDLYEQVMIAYEGNRPTFATLVSSGMSEWSTNEGIFHVYLRYPRAIMSGAEGQEDFYYLQEVPWTMYFDDDIALHGAYWHDGFGYRRSHGCVNLSVTDAYLLYNWASPEFDFSVDNDTGPAVYVYSSGEYK